MVLTGAVNLFQRARRNPEERFVGRLTVAFLVWAGVMTAIGCLGGAVIYLIRLAAGLMEG